MQLQFQRHLSRGFQALVSYSWSHSLDTNSSDISTPGFGGYVTPPSGLYNVHQDYGSSDFDIRHTLSVALTYSIPVMTFDNPVAKGLLRDWAIDMITSARSGTPFDVEYTPANPGPYTDGNGFIFPLRPDQISGRPVYVQDPNAPGGMRLNLAAFTIPSMLGQGSEGRNSIRGFPLVQIDVAVRRQFSINEGLKLQFRAEAFNVINHPNLGNPLNVIGTCAQGVPCTPTYGWGKSQSLLNQSLGTAGGSGGFFGGGLGSLYQVGGPRSLQLALKVQF